MSNMNVLFGDVFDELFLYFKGSFSSHRNQTQPTGNTENMGVNGHIGLIPDYGSDDVCGFPAYSGKFGEFIDGGRHISAKLLHQHSAQSDQVFGFIVWVGNRADEGEKLIEMRGSQVRCSRKMPEKFLGDDVDAFVGALCRKDDGHQKLKGIFVLKLRFRNGHVGGKMGDKCVVSLFFKHE